jgi:D-alanyl-D-alanine carboxypeptidase/D-alanyl-D-alanine-endopeptidase (penicillin-binding protein 4)
MKHRLALLIGLVASLLPTPLLRGSIDSETTAVAQDRLMQRATLGVQVMRLGTSPADLQELYNRNGHTPLTPASNLKLVTTAASLERLGPDFKFRTLLLLRGQDLVLIGDGDPTFGDSGYLKKFGWKATAVFDGWVAQLQKLGITSVRDVIVDDSIFDENFFHPDWPVHQIDAYYEAEVGGMNFNASQIDITVGGGREPILTPSTRYVQLRAIPMPGRSMTVNRQPGTNVINLKGEAPAHGV